MNKISKFILKNLGKITLFIPFFFGTNDISIIIVIILLLLIYFKKSNFTIKKIIQNLKENEATNNNKSDNEDFELNINQEIKEEPIKEEIIKEESIKELKENIKLNLKKNTKDKIDIENSINPYPNKKKYIKLNYTEPLDNYDFVLDINNSICSTPMFNMRTYEDIDFYYNFIIHDYDTKKLHDLIMCKDIHQWMSNSSLSDSDISNELVPIYFCLKNEKINVYEYLKVFINSNGEEKIAFVQKGNDYTIIEKYIEKLIEKNIIEDLLSGKLYTSYNLSINDGVSTFLTKFLSLVLISENFIGEKIKLDIENYHENKSTYQYLLNTLNEDSSVFNTNI